MKFLQTKRCLERSEFPTNLEWLREMNKRSALDDEQQKELYRLEAGFVGEQFVLEALEEFGEEHWVAVPNLWLDYNGQFECDIVVMTHAGVYTFEVKNYSGHYVFREMQCWMNGEKIGFNAINQAQKSYIHLEKLVRGAFPKTNVYGALAFVGPHHTVEVHDEVSDLQIKMRNELRNYIWSIAKQERRHQGVPLDFPRYIKLFERYETEHSYMPEPITPEMNTRVRKGICCSHCGSFDFNMINAYVVCDCGMNEPRENAIVRTICEYGVIHFEKDLVSSEVLDFFGGQISRTNLVRYLKKHFNKTGHNKRTKFLNKRVPFVKIAEEFELMKPRYFICPY